MKRVAILFSRFGNPNQPFLTEWFFRISNSETISIKAFTDIFSREKNRQVVMLKVKGGIRYFYYLLALFQRAFNPVVRNVNWQLVPISKYQPDVIHLLNAQQIDQYQSLLSNSYVKLVVSFRGFETNVRPKTDPEWLDNLRTIYQQATALHFVSDFLKNEAIKMGAPKEKCVVIRRSVDTYFFKPRERINTSSMRFIAVGRLTWQKGYAVLLRAFSEIVKTNTEAILTIIGDGPDAPSFFKDIDALGLTKNVIHYPYLDRVALREALWSADIFVQASLSDALPNSVLEASACGLPVISTWTGGIPEAVNHEQTGLLVSPGDPEALTNAMRSLMDNKNLGLEYGNNGREHMINCFSSKTERENWEHFYLNI